MIDAQLIDDHLEFTSKMFPKGTARGAAIHAQREIQEVIDAIDDYTVIDGSVSRNALIEEYADVFGCLIDSVDRSGITTEELNTAFWKKIE